MSAYPQDVWGQFAHDPRHPAYAGLRAGDEDREVVYRALGEAYALGQLSREEHDERTEYVSQAKALGDLPSVLMDVVAVQHPPPPPPPPPFTPASAPSSSSLPTPPPPPPPSALQPQQVRAGAEKLVRDRLRRQWAGVTVAVFLCLMLSSLSGPQSIVIPLVVTLLLVGRVVHKQSHRGEMVQQEQQRLQEQVTDQLTRRQRGEVRRR